MPFKNQHPLYFVWRSMRDRCLNPKNRQWNDYGGRGVTICSRWDSFHAFLEDMGDRPEGYSLDRIDNEKGYAPDNCRWASRKQQQRNRRIAVYVTVEGVRYRAIELAELAGVKSDTIIGRAKRGLPYSDVVFSGKLKPDYAAFIPAVVAKANATKAARKTCKKGHPYTLENTCLTKEGWRRCRACHNEKMRVYNAAKRIG